MTESIKQLTPFHQSFLFAALKQLELDAQHGVSYYHGLPAVKGFTWITNNAVKVRKELFGDFIPEDLQTAYVNSYAETLNSKPVFQKYNPDVALEDCKSFLDKEGNVSEIIRTEVGVEVKSYSKSGTVFYQIWSREKTFERLANGDLLVEYKKY